MYARRAALKRVVPSLEQEHGTLDAGRARQASQRENNCAFVCEDLDATTLFAREASSSARAASHVMAARQRLPNVSRVVTAGQRSSHTHTNVKTQLARRRAAAQVRGLALYLLQQRHNRPGTKTACVTLPPESVSTPSIQRGQGCKAPPARRPRRQQRRGRKKSAFLGRASSVCAPLRLRRARLERSYIIAEKS